MPGRLTAWILGGGVLWLAGGCGAIVGIGADVAAGDPESVGVRTSLRALGDVATLLASGPLRGGPNPAWFDPASPCLLVGTQPTPLDANALPATFRVYTTFDRCAMDANRQISGTLDAQLQDTHGVFSGAFTPQLRLESADGGLVFITPDPNMSVSYIPDPNLFQVIRTLTGNIHVLVQNATGARLSEMQVANQGLTINESRAAGVFTRTLNGSVTVTDLEYYWTSTLVATQVQVRPETCCHPVSGSLTQHAVRPDGTAIDRTYTFTPTCGLVNVRGAGKDVPISWPACL